MADALELGVDVARAGQIAVGEVAESELDAELQAQFERHLVEGDRALAAVHGGMKMVGRVEMRAVGGRERDVLDRPAFAVGQLLDAQPGEELHHFGRRLAVVAVLDLRAEAGRIGGDVVLQRHRDVDQIRHGSPPSGEQCIGSPRGSAKEVPMPAYWVAPSRAIDPVEYKKYTDLVPDIIARHGGKMLARGGKFRIMEGPEKFHRFIVIEFPTFDQAVASFPSPQHHQAPPSPPPSPAHARTLTLTGTEP